MDDRSWPAAHVRYNLSGLSALFPAAYLFSYVMAGPDEPIHDTADMLMMVRTRMPGVIGLTTDLTLLTEREFNELNQEIELAKRLREQQVRAVTYSLTSQSQDYGNWSVLQQVGPAIPGALVFAYANGAHGPVRVMLRGINPDAIYELRSADRGRIGDVRGADLIAGGLEISEAPESATQVLVLDPIASATRVK
jgi:alpha-galactosidase